ncbi:two-component system response regulator [Gleimia sp. 6138-11-ORH1]|uniref:two-component system response regulator n=1 Tax=Gleimia sp. 6138-11-ORH1 TaxID=2973937 RepID=UPI002168E511|nr:two-component system response regulator [Gleimia sp. 6138-11-ORH1]MCS4484452.1 two-component system response regulator [Gleimia sp. 6138-11-ORH1]
MTQTENRGSINVLLYSDNSEVRQMVMDAVGVRPGKDFPTINWIEAATEAGAVMKFTENDIHALVLDGETQKVGGMALLRRLNVENDNTAPSLMLVARQQDEWLAQFSGATHILTTPFDAVTLNEGIKKILR